MNTSRIPQAAPMGQPRRISSDAAWPLRRADGTKWHELPKPETRNGRHKKV